MNKHDARELVSSGRVTLAHLRHMLTAAGAWPFGPSVVNPGFSKTQAIEIFRNAVASDQRDGATPLNTSARDELFAVNVVRECGLVAWLNASGIEAPSGGETRSGSTEGESPAPEGGDAQPDPVVVSLSQPLTLEEKGRFLRVSGNDLDRPCPDCGHPLDQHMFGGPYHPGPVIERPKPVLAVQYASADAFQAVLDFAVGGVASVDAPGDPILIITPQGGREARVGDWIIKAADGFHVARGVQG